MITKKQLISILLWCVFLFTLFKPLFDQDKYRTANKADGETIDGPVEEQPLHDVILPLFANISDVKEKKRQFFKFLKPAVLKENARISTLRTHVIKYINKIKLGESLTNYEQEKLSSLLKKYKIKKSLIESERLTHLLSRIDIVPASLVLVQAANESAWGTSRFARIGLNFFGIWCFQKGCGMVPKGRDAGLKHEVAAFSSIDNAVKHYLHNINTNSAYFVFREIRTQLHQQNLPLSAEILATGLLPYSERGTDYILEITDMIRHNRTYLEVTDSE